MKNSFEKTLRELRNGHALSDLSEQLTAVVASVRATGKSGELRLKLAVKPASRGETVTVLVEDEITTKLAKLDRPNTIFYSTEDNLLTRTDPRQIEMELKAVPAVVEDAREGLAG